MTSLAKPAPIHPLSPARLVTALLFWLGGIAAIGASGLLLAARPLIPLLIVGPAVVTLALYSRNARVRHTLDAVPLRGLVSVHLIRAPIGAMFLFMMARGELPELFGVRAGYGDIVAGVGALLVLPFATNRKTVAGWATLAWNVVALGDILLVVVTAQYLVFIAQDPDMLILANLPWIFIPAVLVPVVLVTHVLIFQRLRRGFRLES